MREKRIERYLTREVEKIGGLCLKLAPLSLVGFPDRTILLPGGFVAFAELKSERGRLSRAQIIWGHRLAGLGFDWRVLSSKADVDYYLETLI